MANQEASGEHQSQAEQTAIMQIGVWEHFCVSLWDNALSDDVAIALPSCMGPRPQLHPTPSPQSTYH